MKRWGQALRKPTPLTHSIKVKCMCPFFESDSIEEDKYEGPQEETIS